MPVNTVELHEEAAVEYDAAFEWYLQPSSDVANRFDAEVERALSEIARNPQRWALGSHNTRRFLLRGFPYLLIYREKSENRIQVIAVAHTSRNPGYWKRRT